MKSISVTQLNEYIRQVMILDPILRKIYVEGEIISLTNHKNGFQYLTLGDGESTIQCVNYHPSNNKINEKSKVLIKGHVQVYVKRCVSQIVIDEIELKEDNVLDKVMILNKKFEKEGIYKIQKKFSKIRYPQNIALLTSETGAVIHDIYSNAKRRWPLTKISLFPVNVQGLNAISEIMDKMDFIDIKKYDYVLLARGGGAEEEFDIFNNEKLVRKIANFKLPVISALGHEINYSLVDKASFYSVSTPTEAVEFLLPDKVQELEKLNNLKLKLKDNMAKKLLKNSAKLKQYNLNQVKKILFYKISNERRKIEQNNLKVNLFTKNILNSYKKRNEIVLMKIQSKNPLMPLDRNFVYLERNKKNISIDSLNIDDSVLLIGKNRKVKVKVKEVDEN
jgi:exodeoxyribonuclease VII large subunit